MKPSSINEKLYESITAILDDTEQKIVNRGKDYYYEGMIDTLIKDKNGYFLAEVLGSEDEPYHIEIIIGQDGSVAEYFCDCPYDYSDVCKHIVAVLLAVKAGDYECQKEPVTRKKKEDKADIYQLVAQADIDKLREFILHYAKENNDFRTELLSAFRKLPEDEVLSAVKDRVSTVIRYGTHRGYIDYRGCDEICYELDEILTEADEHITHGYAVLGFQIGLHILLKGMKLASIADSSSGSLTYTLDEACNVIDRACEAASATAGDEDKKFIYDKGVKESLNKVFDGWGETNYRLLRSCVRFITKKNESKLYDALDKLSEKYSSWSSYAQIDDKLTRLVAIRVLEGEKAVDNYIADNIEIDNFRDMAVKSALDKGDYAEAERLCVERLRREPNEHGIRVAQKEWTEKLFAVYEKSGNTEKQLEISNRLLLSGDIGYYDKYKTLMKQTDRWEGEYGMLLSELREKLPPYTYMQILSKENELRLLLEQVKITGEELIFTYGKQLAQMYPKDVYAIYKEQISRLAAQAANRNQYGKVCDHMKDLYNIGGVDAVTELIAEFREIYNRRPAMLDELSKLENRLAKKN